MKNLQQHLENYLQLRRNVGFKLQKEGEQLPKLMMFLEQNNAPYITTPLAVDWAMQSPAATQAKRMTIVRGFARYVKAFDTRTEVPPSDILARRSLRPSPYIYSDEEIRRLLEVARRYPWDKPSGTYSCLFGLLAVSGLRSGEAMRLRVRMST
jgi:integrase/recombinase XerD